jgi:hypothetical protein
MEIITGVAPVESLCTADMDVPPWIFDHPLNVRTYMMYGADVGLVDSDVDGRVSQV